MTSQNSTTDKKRASFMPFFNFSARRFWTTVFLFTIILFFILPVPVLMIISGSAPLSASDIEGLKEGFASDWPVVIRYFTVIALSAFAIVLSCSRFKYLKNKVSVDFYHSLPIKRGRLFLTQLAVSALALVISYVFNVLFTIIVLASNGLITSVLILNILAVTVDTFVYALFFYGLSTLVGMVSGLTPVQLTLTAVAVFIIPATYALSVGFISMFSEHMWVDFYFHLDMFEKMTPAIRFIINENVLNIREITALLITSAVMLIGAYAIYVYRKSERSGTPVVFSTLGEVIKYILVFVGTLSGGLLFHTIMNDFFWMVFGMICGALLTFMLTNTILNKTARAMFKGWKGLCIFGGAAAIAFVVLYSNAFGINEHVPAPALTAKVAVSFDNDGGTMVFRDKEVIEALHYIYKHGEDANEFFAYSYPSLKYDNTAEYAKSYVTDYAIVRIVFYPKFGLPNAKYIHVYNKADFVEQFKTILNSEEFAEQYASELESIDESGRIHVALPNLIFRDDKMYNYLSGVRSHRFDDDPTFEEVAKKCGVHIMLEEMENINFDFFQQPAVGYVNIYSGDTDVMLPIFTSMTKTAAFHKDEIGYEYSPDKLCKALAENASNFRILGYDENGNEKVMKISDREQMLEILCATTNPMASASYTSPFTLKDTRFRISYNIPISDYAEISYYYDENGVEHAVTEYKDSTESYYETYTATFLLDQVPEYVVEYFS